MLDENFPVKRFKIDHFLDYEIPHRFFFGGFIFCADIFFKQKTNM